MHVFVTCKHKKDQNDQKQPKKGGDTIFPIISQWGLSVAMDTRVLIQSASKHYEPFHTLVMLGIPVMRYDRAARPCALNSRLAALKCRFGRPPNALSSVGVWLSMHPLCASFIQNVITLTGHLFIGKNVAYPNTVTCLLISNCSGKQTD